MNKKNIILILLISIVILNNILNKNEYLFKKTYDISFFPPIYCSIILSNNLTVSLETEYFPSCIDCYPSKEKYGINIIVIYFCILGIKSLINEYRGSKQKKS